MNAIQDQKRQLRARLRERRSALSAAARMAASEVIRANMLTLPEIKVARIVFCFISSPEEVQTLQLIDALLEQGRTVLVPSIPAGGEMMAAHFPGWSELAPGGLGILTPVSPREFGGNVDVCITPGLGFTVRGERLGYGRGYYDRWFASHGTARRVGIGFDCQIVDQIPVTDSDVLLNRVLTEARTIEVR